MGRDGRLSVMNYLGCGGVEGRCFWRGYSDLPDENPIEKFKAYEVLDLDTYEEGRKLAASIRFINDSLAPGRARLESVPIEEILRDLEAHPWELRELGKREK